MVQLRRCIISMWRWRCLILVIPPSLRAVILADDIFAQPWVMFKCFFIELITETCTVTPTYYVICKSLFVSPVATATNSTNSVTFFSILTTIVRSSLAEFSMMSFIFLPLDPLQRPQSSRFDNHNPCHGLHRQSIRDSFYKIKQRKR